MPAAFVYCEACGWEGADADECPECGGPTTAAGLLL